MQLFELPCLEQQNNMCPFQHTLSQDNEVGQMNNNKWAFSSGSVGQRGIL